MMDEISLEKYKDYLVNHYESEYDNNIQKKKKEKIY